MTALIGRAREHAEVLDRLEDHRLVTVVGPGGIGKTSLARAVAADRADRFPLGAHFVDLTLVDDADAVGGAIAAQLGFPSFTALINSPSDQPALLVVDNCEHVLDAAAEAIDALLASCDAPVIVATSRSPLDLPGESLVALGPLHDASDSVQLFLDRARDAGTEPPADQQEAVVALCRALDGVPLALEIAAARTRVLTPTEILDRLDDLDTLARPHFRGVERHKTLRATIEWSYVQLDDADRARFDRLGVLAAPFTVETARAVADDDDDLTTLDGLDVLVRNSLVVTEQAGDVTRYRLLHTLRTFARERLAERGELDATWARFADLTLVRAFETGRGARRAWRPDAVTRLVDLADDVLACIRWAAAHDESPDRAVGLLALLWGVIHDSRVEDVALVGELVLARWPEPAPRHWADAMATLATARHLLGDAEGALDLARQAREVVETPVSRCTVNRVIGRAHSTLGDLESAAAAFTEAIAGAREGGLGPLARESTTFLAVITARQGNPDEAVEVLEAIEAEAADDGDRINELWARIAVAHVLMEVDPAACRDTLVAMAAASRETSYSAGIVASLQGLATAAILLDDDATAASALDELLDSFVHGELVGDLRSALRTVAVLMHRGGDDRWAGMAAAAYQLALVSSFTTIAPELLPLPDPGTASMTTNDAVGLARRFLATPVADAPARSTTGEATAAGSSGRATPGWSSGPGGSWSSRARRAWPTWPGCSPSRDASCTAWSWPGPPASSPRPARSSTTPPGGSTSSASGTSRPRSTRPRRTTTTPGPKRPKLSSTPSWSTWRRPSASAAGPGEAAARPSGPDRPSPTGSGPPCGDWATSTPNWAATSTPR